MAQTSHKVFVVGTRAQLIKMAPVIVVCERRGLPITLLMTGQHQETMQDIVDEFGLRSPQVPVMSISERSTVGSLLRWFPTALSAMTARVRALVEKHGSIDVLVHGDTLSTLVGAWAGRRGGARVVHLESGLTSGRWHDPFPEEVCRRIVFRLTDVAMCPNSLATDHMRHFRKVRVIDTGGNTIIDAVLLSGASPAYRDPTKPYLVVSLHRFQNLFRTSRLQALIDLVERLAQHYPIHFVLHPATRKRLEAVGLDAPLKAAPKVHLSPRLGYGAFLRLAAGAECVLTDGGSNQEELAVLGVPTLIMRERTERPDGLLENAVMEADVPNGIFEFLVGRGFEALRRAAKLPVDLGPSVRIADALITSS